LLRVKKTQVPVCRVTFGSSSSVLVNLDTGFVQGRPVLDAALTVKKGKAVGISFDECALIAASECESGILYRGAVVPTIKLDLSGETECCTGVAMHRRRGTEKTDIYFRLASGSRWCKSSDMWLKYGAGQKSQDVKDALQLGTFCQLPGLVGRRMLMELHVAEKTDEKGRVFPEIVLGQTQLKMLDYPVRPFVGHQVVYFSKDVVWVDKGKEPRPQEHNNRSYVKA